MKNSLLRLRFSALGILFIASFILSCAINPVTGKRQLMLISEKREKAMGLAYDPQVIQEFGLYDDKILQDFISDYGKRMGRISHRPTIGYEFRILDSPVVNAFAVPGGYVYFTRGIMAHFNNEAEFAGVLGHEIGHVTARHSAQQQSQQILAQIGFIGAMLASEKFRQYSDLAQTGLGLMFLKFSRNHESQSDKLGVEYSTKIGYDAHEMAGFFKTIERIQDASGASLPTFLSTHPDPGDRYVRVNQLATKEQAKATSPKTLNVNRDKYLRMIDGLMYGEDPQLGYVENDVFYHPQLKFQFPTPKAWQTINSNSQVQIAPKDGKAAIIFTLSGEKTLAQAKQAAISADSLQVISSQNISVNGNSAVALTADLNPQVRLLMYLIQYNGNIYKFTGLSETPNFNGFEATFANSFKGFKALSDQSKINVYADKINIVTVAKDQTLSDALKANNQPSARLEELAILNGMELRDKVTKGMLIKTVEKGTKN
ncbi:MAG: M48 family metalloprotease [Saprospiraceae bacterium]|nr:M48 family metalloprotease [Saprospiraceae bacterium]MCF8250039.1 M48 family metalloprotease [Saprospiraceae bacterium]MCF8278921.1 M48 family metalloprotease [Bacteroidales bacterium]MCF8311052.1 M48 family metalloprotease [Saprospiraceae bacterium]MCF8439612.1 M48 family metalloprotease [Saprospiraceae bacterium]